MEISLIVAHGKNKELGLNNKLLWHIPEDLKHFQKITNNHYLLMGRNTYDSIYEYLKKPLPNRFSLVLTNKEFKEEENAKKVSSFEEALEIAKKNNESELIIIGGASVYKKYFEKASKLYITEVDYEGEADCYFEGNIDNSWKLVDRIILDKCIFKTYKKECLC